MKWTCNDCGTEFNLKETIVPKSCCVCGSTAMESDEYTQKVEMRQKFEADLVAVTEKLNDLYGTAEPLLVQYKQIMNYFKGLYTKKQITVEEYVEKTSLFKYKKTGGRPIGSKVTDDTDVDADNVDMPDADIDMDAVQDVAA